MKPIPHSSAIPGVAAGSDAPPPPPPAVDEMPKGDGSGWTPEKERIVLGPYEYIVQNPGKDMRKQLIEAFNAWLEVPKERLDIIAKAITMLHNASLLCFSPSLYPVLPQANARPPASTMSKTPRCSAAASPSPTTCLASRRR